MGVFVCIVFVSLMYFITPPQGQPLAVLQELSPFVGAGCCYASS